MPVAAPSDRPRAPCYIRRRSARGGRTALRCSACCHGRCGFGDARGSELVEGDLLQRFDQRSGRPSSNAAHSTSPSSEDHGRSRCRIRPTPPGSSRRYSRDSGRGSRDRPCPHRRHRKDWDRRCPSSWPASTPRPPGSQPSRRRGRGRLVVAARTSRAIASIGFPNQAPFSGYVWSARDQVAIR